MTFTKPCPQTKLQAVSTTATNRKECADKAEQYLGAQEVGARTSGPKARCSSADNSTGAYAKSSQQHNQCIMAYPSASELQTKREIKLTLQAAEHFRIAGKQH